MVNVAMWGKALRIMPRVSKEEWKALDIVSRWLIATRSAVFVMTAASAALGGLLAYRDGHFSWLFFAACMLGLVFAHATNNLINDLTDHIKGVDKDNYFRAQYGPQPLEHGLMTKGQLGLYIVVTGLIAMAAGVFLVMETGWITAALLAAGAFFVLFYTWPLKFMGLGEPSVLIVWGPLMVGGTYFVTSGGQWNWNILLISLIYALGPTAVLFGKHTDKSQEDAAKGIHTLPVILGEKASRLTTIAMLAAQLILLIPVVISGALTPIILISFLALREFYQVYKIFIKPRPTECPEDFPQDAWPLYLVAHAFVYNRRFSLYFLAGLIIDTGLKVSGIWG